MKIEKLDYYGRGISRSSGKVYFIENALKDEDVSITLLKEKKKYCEAKLKEISNISKDRTEAKCKYYNFCGGCQLMHIKGEKQEEFKKEKVEEILKKFLKYNKDVNDIVFSKNFNYRNKVVLHVKDNKLGFYKNKTNELIELDRCLLLNPVINDLISYLKNYIELKNIEKITIKVGNKTNEVMLIIDGSIAYYQNLLEIVDVLIINEKVMTTKDYITSYIGNKKYIIKRNSFFQVNYDISTRMYNKVKDVIVKEKSKNVLDLYCGTGTIGIYISDVVSKITGIEVVSDAIEAANINKKINNVENIEFILGKVEDKLDFISNNNIDTVIVDPPRSGLHKKVIPILERISPKTIIYVSCDPITMARDIKLLSNNYELVEVTPYDMFPNTYHVETVCVLKKK
jgi:uncharacterized RNA methyltransferase CTC_02481